MLVGVVGFLVEVVDAFVAVVVPTAAVVLVVVLALAVVCVIVPKTLSYLWS